MTPEQIEKLINATKELHDIRDEYQKTEQLLQEQKWDQLSRHIQCVKINHPWEAACHNAINPNMPHTVEENARNCMAFLNNLFTEKLAVKLKELGE